MLYIIFLNIYIRYIRIFPFLQIKQENKLLRKAYEDYFIDRFKPLLNQKV